MSCFSILFIFLTANYIDRNTLLLIVRRALRYAKYYEYSPDKKDCWKLNKESRQTLRKIFSYVGPYKGYFIAGLMALSISNTLFMAFPYLAGKMLDVASGQLGDFPLTSIAEIGVAMLVVFLAQSIFAFFRVLLLAQVSERGMADLRKEVFSRLLSLNLTFYDTRRTGELISRITADASTLYDLFSITLA